MAAEVIFGPVGPAHPQYDTAINYVNSLRSGNNLPQFPHGEPAVIHKGELEPTDEKRLLEDVARSSKKPAQKQDKPKKARKSNYGRWELLNNWVDFGQHYFTTAECVVWLTLFRLADGKTNVAEFGVRCLAEKAGVSRNTADKAVRRFVKAGVLVCIFKSRKPGTPSKYRLADATDDLTKKQPKPR